MSTISSSLTHSITIGNAGSYASPLTITSAGAVSNSGTGDAVSSSLTNAFLDNQGVISATGAFSGVSLAAGGTVINSGTIQGGSNTAISFGGTGANRLVLDPGFKFGGVVAGSTGAGATNTLELASAASVGTVTGLGYEFHNFGQTTVDVGAQWTLGGNSTLGAGVTLSDLGTLTNAGTLTGVATLIVDAATFINNGYLGLTATLSAGGYLTNSSTGTIGYSGTGVYGGAAAATVVNRGTISGTNYGVNLYHGGSVSNLGGTALIEGFTGVSVYNASGTVINSGTIVGTGNLDEAVYFTAGGTVSNIGGQITGFIGIDISGGAGLVTNSGTIIGTSTIRSGIRLQAGGTVIDSGTITGGNGTAVDFGGAGSNLLVLEKGFSLSGVYGKVGATNTVELAGTVTAAVTASYNALALSHFSDVVFGSGGHDTLKVTNTSGTLPVTLSGFTLTSDVVDLTGLAGGTLQNGGTVNGSNQLIVNNGSETVTLQLDPGETYTGLVWQTGGDGGSGTDVSAACYCRGTLIRTERGEAAIEDLAIGDRVVTISGEAKPIRWIGHRAYDRRFIAGNRDILPVRITAGALADGVPARDLYVSPEHSLYFDGVLVAARQLLNGATIVQEAAAEEIEYFHIELDAHDVIFAEGAPAESYVECDNRGKFQNAAEFALLYPEGDHQRWQFCAPLVQWESEEPNPIREALMRRAEELGHGLDLDPDLHLVVDGAVVRPDSVDGQLYRFTVPAGSRAAALASRSAVPAEIRAAARDLRRLGVPVERLVLQDAHLRIEAGHGHAGLSEGFHDDEPSHRWTDGLARLPERWLSSFPGEFTLEVSLIAADLPYRLPHPDRTRAVA